MRSSLLIAATSAIFLGLTRRHKRVQPTVGSRSPTRVHGSTIVWNSRSLLVSGRACFLPIYPVRTTGLNTFSNQRYRSDHS